MTTADGDLDAFAEWERSGWEQRAQAYAVSVVDLTRGAARALLDAAGVGAGTRLLDVGAGPGTVALLARERGAAVVCADQSAAMCALARTAGLEAHVAPAEALPFDDGRFDAVVASFVLNHLPRPELAVAEMVRVAGGRVAACVWDRPAEVPALSLVGQVARELGVRSDAPAGPEVDRFADDDAFRALLGELADVRVERVAWSVRVRPAEWFDAVAGGTVRAGALVAAASGEQRDALRQRFVEAATERYGDGDAVVLPAQAVLASGRRR